jgi:hypothetical protein
VYGSKFWPLAKKGRNMLLIFERRILRMIYSPVKGNGIWSRRYSNELYTLYDEEDLVKVTTIGRMKWLEYLVVMEKLDPCRKLTLPKPEGSGREGRLQLNWLESAEEDLR